MPSVSHHPDPRSSALAIRTALAAAPSPAAQEKAGDNSFQLQGSIALSHTPLASHPHRDLNVTSANLERQLLPGSQSVEGKGAGLWKRKSERDPGEKLESWQAGRLGKSDEEADPPRSEREAQKPHREL